MSKDLVTVSGGLSVPKELAEFYQDNAGVGSENLNGSIPQLKVTEANSQNEGVDGQYVAAGQFYYQPTKEAFKSTKVSIMAISRGFYALDNQKEPKPKFTQLMGGMILETMQPFVMFISGTRLQNMWDFGKEIKPFTKNVPMFAFEVELSLEQMKTNHGINHVVVFKVTRDKKGLPVLLSDAGTATMLKNGVEAVQDMFNNFIAQKEVDRNTGELLSDKQSHEVFDAVAGEPAEAEPVDEPPADYESIQAKYIADDVPF